MTYIDLSGWGAANTCSFELGEHTIEVYVDDFLIHRKKFLVELSPADKIESEIKNAEAEIEKVKRKRYFKAEFDSLKAGMEKIKEWQFMRSQSERETQIFQQQEKINALQKKAEQERISEERRLIKKIVELKEKLKNTEF